MTLFLAMPGSEYVEAVRPFHGHDGSYPFAAEKISGIEADREEPGFCPEFVYIFGTWTASRTKFSRALPAAPPTSVRTANDMLDLGTYDAVRNALQRLTAAGAIRRIAGA